LTSNLDTVSFLSFCAIALVDSIIWNWVGNVNRQIEILGINFKVDFRRFERFWIWVGKLYGYGFNLNVRPLIGGLIG